MNAWSVHAVSMGMARVGASSSSRSIGRALCGKGTGKGSRGCAYVADILIPIAIDSVLLRLAPNSPLPHFLALDLSMQEAASVVSHAREREQKAALRSQRRLRRLKEIALEASKEGRRRRLIAATGGARRHFGRSLLLRAWVSCESAHVPVDEPVGMLMRSTCGGTESPVCVSDVGV